MMNKGCSFLRNQLKAEGAYISAIYTDGLYIVRKHDMQTRLVTNIASSPSLRTSMKNALNLAV